jgi:hypothetical protein
MKTVTCEFYSVFAGSTSGLDVVLLDDRFPERHGNRAIHVQATSVSPGTRGMVDVWIGRREARRKFQLRLRKAKAGAA